MNYIDQLFEHFVRLHAAPGRAMTVHVAFSQGTGALLISKKEWTDQPDDMARKELIRVRRESLYQRICRQ